MRSNRFVIGALLIGLSWSGLVQTEAESHERVVSCEKDDAWLTFAIETGAAVRRNAVVKMLVGGDTVPDGPDVVVHGGGQSFPAQLAEPGIECDQAESMKLLTFVIPELPPDQKLEFEVRPGASTPVPTFEWHDDRIAEAELRFEDRAVVRYMYEPLDDATPQRRDETCKPYHHVFSPDGSTLLTKGPGGLFSHHRGIFFGYNQIRYGDREADTWHCRQGESQTQIHSRSRIGGPVMGRDQNVISWNGRDGQPFATEIRQLTCFRFGKGTLIEFHAILKSSGTAVTLDGDPQHAGVQFRASQQVADQTRTQTFYIRPDGVGKPGQFRNWSNKTEETKINKAHRNLPWNAMCFVIGDQPYTCVYLDHPENPKPAMFSERDYGRFGSFFRYELRSDQPLRVRYRYWIQSGVMSINDIRQLSRDFVDPITVSIQ